MNVSHDNRMRHLAARAVRLDRNCNLYSRFLWLPRTGSPGRSARQAGVALHGLSSSGAVVMPPATENTSLLPHSSRGTNAWRGQCIGGQSTDESRSLSFEDELRKQIEVVSSSIGSSQSCRSQEMPLACMFPRYGTVLFQSRQTTLEPIYSELMCLTNQKIQFCYRLENLRESHLSQHAMK